MAISASTVWELRAAGSDNNGGGFVAGASGTDLSQQDAAQDSGTNLTVDVSTNTDVTPDGYVVSSADVGNIIQITAGAGFSAGFYEILSIQGGTKWRLDRSPASISTSGGTWAIGGALASPGKVAGALVADNVVWQESGDYPTSNGTPNTSGNRVEISAAFPGVKWIGYGSVRGDGGEKPVIRATAGSIVLFAIADGYQRLRLENVAFDGDGQSTVDGVYFGGGQFVSKFVDCDFTDLRYGCLTHAPGTLVLRCRATGCSSTGFQGQVTQYVDCVAHDNAGFGFVSLASFYDGCIATRNASSGFFSNNYYAFCKNCVSYDNNSEGFAFGDFGPGGESASFFNCISYGNLGYGFSDGQAAHGASLFWNCAGGANTGGNYTGGWPTSPDAALRDFVTLSANPFASPDATIATISDAFTNFQLNTTSGGGANCRGSGLTPYRDLGAAQHQDSGGAGMIVPIRRGGTLMKM